MVCYAWHCTDLAQIDNMTFAQREKLARGEERETLKESFPWFFLALDEGHAPNDRQYPQHQYDHESNGNGLVSPWTKPWTNILNVLWSKKIETEWLANNKIAIIIITVIIS
jgi:hypothetical protein